MEQRSQGFDPVAPPTYEHQVTSTRVFDAFRLDLRDERLWRDNEVLPRLWVGLPGRVYHP
jgi:hypothetical protein